MWEIVPDLLHGVKGQINSVRELGEAYFRLKSDDSGFGPADFVDSLQPVAPRHADYAVPLTYRTKCLARKVFFELMAKELKLGELEPQTLAKLVLEMSEGE